MTDQLERLTAALADRYTIERELGAGGMATVYLADDVKHHRKVAVKVLRPDLAATLGPDRFIREIEIAAGLTHPHVLPVHDSGDADGFLFYVMPYIEGESLRDKLQKGGELPVDEVIRLVREIADALGHAHKRGVVHRDIKPDNVLLFERHALVMDFGVAKAVSEAKGRQQLTSTGIALGTPSYMAPEQAAADANIDHRADIYALGVMAYELLTGRPPFEGPNAQSVLAAHLTDAPEPVTKYREVVPAALSDLVMRCLEKKAADRWQSAEDLVPLLEALGTSSHGVTPTTIPITATGRRRRPLAAAGGFAAVAAVVGIVAVTFPRGGTELVEDRVLVTAFLNETDERGLASVGKIAADLLSRGLQEIRLVEVVDPRAALTEAAAEQVSSRELARRLGAATFVSGSYYRLGDSLRLQAQVTETASGKLIQSLDPVAAAADDPMPGLMRLSQRVMASVAIHFSPEIAVVAQAIRPPASYSAYQEFITGVELVAQGNPLGGMLHIRAALEEEPDFAAAALYMATVHLLADQPASTDSIVRSLGDERGRLTELERLWLDYLQSVVSEDLPAAYRFIQQSNELAPGVTETVFMAGITAIAVNRPAEAVEYLARLDPEYGMFAVTTWLWEELTEAYHMLGDHEAELDAAQRGREQFPDRLPTLLYEIRALAALGRLEDVALRVDEALTLPQEPGWSPAAVMRSAAAELLVHGHGEASSELLERAIAWYDARPGEFPASRALTLYWAERWTEARAAYQVLADKAPDNLQYQQHLGIIAARLGDRDETSRVEQWLARQDRPYEKGVPTLVRARIAAALGERDRAVDLLRDAFSQGIGYGIGRHSDPAFTSLRDFAPFQELMRPKG